MKDYIELEGLIQHNLRTKITEEEMDEVMTDFIKLLESKGLELTCSYKLLDDDEIEDTIPET